MIFALVGGHWIHSSLAGLWCCALNYSLTGFSVDVGARLLIRDLMCFVPVCSSSYLLVSLLLSAVIGTTLPRLACGFGAVGMFLVVLIPISVLDLLYGN